MKLAKSAAIIWEIFKRDIKSLIKNPVAVIIVIGVIFLPSVYAWSTIGADWDPYGQTGNLKVGFANEDEGADNAMIGHINVGDEVEKELRENHNFGWQFVDEQQALTGVESGEYYATIVIPADFSRDFLKVLDGQIEEPKIKYYVNEKISATAPEFTDTGAETVETEINSQFTATVSKAVVELAQKAGVNIEDSARAARGSLTAGVEEAQQLTDELNTALEQLAPALEAAQGADEAAKDTIGTLKNSLPGLENDLSVAEGQLRDLRAKVGTFGTGVMGATNEAAFALSGAAGATQVKLGEMQARLESTEGALGSAVEALKEVANEENLRKLQAVDPELAEKLRELMGGGAGAGSDVGADANSLLGRLEKLQSDIGAALSATNGTLETVNNVVQKNSEELKQLSGQFSSTVIPEIETSLDSFADALGTLKGVVTSLSPVLDSTEVTLNQLSVTLDVTKKAGEGVKSTLAAAQEMLKTALTDLTAVENSQSAEKLAQLLNVNPEDISEFMAAPVQLETEVVYPIKNYGTGVAPFFTNIAMWVAGFILVAILHLTIDPKGLPKFSVTEAYLGRLMLFMLLGVLQGIVVCTGDLIMGIQCENPAAFIFAGVVAILLYVNIMYALVFAMRHLGRAIGVVMLIIQIPGASGEYPVQMMPEFYQTLHPFLPFTYSIDAMREATGGMYGANYALDLLALVPFLVLALVFGLVVGRYTFNLEALFDKELAATDLLLTEKRSKVVQKYHLRPIIGILLKDAGYRKKLVARAERFQKRYPTLIRIGWVLMISIPILMVVIGMILPRSADLRLILLVCMVVGILATGGYMISVEYLNYSLKRQMEEANRGDAELDARSNGEKGGKRKNGDRMRRARERSRR